MLNLFDTRAGESAEIYPLDAEANRDVWINSDKKIRIMWVICGATENQVPNHIVPVIKKGMDYCLC